MIWSYSRVNAYYTCPYMFYLQYISKKEKRDNAFAQYGSLCHKVFEKYYNKKITLFDLGDCFRSMYNDFITESFPYRIGESYYNNGLKMMSRYSDPFYQYRINGVEEKIRFDIDGIPFCGYIDLEIEDSQGIHICDHKSLSKFKSQKEHHAYLRQLYLYSKYIIDKYGEEPKSLIFHLFRSAEIVDIPFDRKEYNKAIDWAKSIVEIAQTDQTYVDKIEIEYADGNIEEFKHDDWFCNQLCSMRNHCERADV